MYKLFLCLRYLRSKVLPYLAILVVAFCVWLLLTWVSIMSGFLAKVEKAAKGLFGDIVIESAGHRGLAHYDEFIAKMKKEVPEVQAAGPFIMSVGMLRVEADPDFREYVQIAGIRLPDRIDETDFEEGLYAQKNIARPTFDPDPELLKQSIRKHQKDIRAVLERDYAEEMKKLTPKELEWASQDLSALPIYLSKYAPLEKRQLLRRIYEALEFHDNALGRLENIEKNRVILERAKKELVDAEKKGASETELDVLREKIEELQDGLGYEEKQWRVILGLGIPGLSFRTDRGEFIRYLVPGHRIVLYVMPLGKGLDTIEISPNIHKFTIIDDNRADVSSIDSKIVYIPFETLQKMNRMDAKFSAEDPSQVIVPPRCSQIHIKVKGKPDERELRRVAKKVLACWEKFAESYEDQPFQMKPATQNVMIETWRQRQSQVVGPLEKQRTLAVSITCIMSLVGMAVVFIILYTLVVQKTRDIGVLKAVGASNIGVAGLFFLYGGIIGAVGAALGVTMSYFTVRYINTIQDGVDWLFGFRLWTADTFMFEKIPNIMDWNMAWWVIGGAVLSGLIGATLPAISAARMQPVDALRYE